MQKKAHKIIPSLKMITDEGLNFSYVVDNWELPKELSIKFEYLYILDCVNHQNFKFLFIKE